MAAPKAGNAGTPHVTKPIKGATPSGSTTPTHSKVVSGKKSGGTKGTNPGAK